AAAGFLGVEIALQDQNSGDLVDHGPVLGAGAAGGVEMAVGFGGGEALVPKVYGQSEGLAQGFGKGMGFGGLGADVAGHVQGIAENNGRTAEFAQEAAEGFQVLLDVFAHQGKDRLGGQAELVGDSDADAAVTEIEAEEAGGHWMMVQGTAKGRLASKRFAEKRSAKGQLAKKRLAVSGGLPAKLRPGIRRLKIKRSGQERREVVGKQERGRFPLSLRGEKTASDNQLENQRLKVPGRRCDASFSSYFFFLWWRLALWGSCSWSRRGRVRRRSSTSIRACPRRRLPRS